MHKMRTILIAGAAGLVFASGAQAAEQLLSGAVSSQSGQKLDGVTVSAKLEGSTITTSVYTDAAGNYYFPPLKAGKYSVWAQALGFETTKTSVDLAARRRHNLVLPTMTDPARRMPHRPPPGAMVHRGLPRAASHGRSNQEVIPNHRHGLPSAGLNPEVPLGRRRMERVHHPEEIVGKHGPLPGTTAKPNEILERNQQ